MRIDLGDVTLAYDLEGPEGAPVVVLSHCFSADRQFWRAQLPALADYRVLRYDVRGHGQSAVTPPPYTLDLFGDDVARLLDALDIERAHFCGISMSGMIGQNVALRHGRRLRSLSLINTTSDYGDDQRDAWVARIAAVKQDGIEALHDALLERWFRPESLAPWTPAVTYMSTCYRNFSPVAFEGAASAMRDLAYSKRLPEIRLPTLVVAGAEDVATPVAMSEAIAEAIPGAELRIIEATGHLSPIDQPEAFNRVLADFLARQA
ncbi:MAG: alpha/beta fold hydrolase [Alphaproteobacteria bacterium]|jgi:3-oxoadipate enol-lactonase|nr:alpha/beta fold hydrolase [Alphaproteobacteria bacterium]